MGYHIHFENRHRVVRHLERRMVLPVAVPWIVLTETHTEYTRHFKNGLLPLNCFKFTVSLTVKLSFASAGVVNSAWGACAVGRSMQALWG